MFYDPEWGSDDPNFENYCKIIYKEVRAVLFMIKPQDKLKWEDVSQFIWLGFVASVTCWTQKMKRKTNNWFETLTCLERKGDRGDM